MKLIPLLLILLLFGCQKKDGPKMITAEKKTVVNPYLPVTLSDKVSLMQFNVENLFDTTHDIGKVDYTFLPFAVKEFKEHKEECGKISNKKWRNQCLFLDWSKVNLDKKMKELAAAILKQNGGHGPDVLVMEEVENISVLEDFRKKYLSSVHYNPAILIEGKDARGIDTAILSKLPFN